jgi:hypothetical protein
MSYDMKLELDEVCRLSVLVDVPSWPLNSADGKQLSTARYFPNKTLLLAAMFPQCTLSKTVTVILCRNSI